ncbi:hypothetical protein L3X38_030635 [Prunus dulcis]|uniref:Integrase catalytic domain-containing protein n=1 Tax=Prunus dulcis TaxID=3755 RepID=A0AAD4YU78_PRUDU|nr:hypothetical protein L3X38_030635 [Prunus dulcis]
MVETQFHTRIQVLRSDNGGEFLNHDLNQFLQDHDIIHQCSSPYTPQQNGVAERKNRHLLEVVRAYLFGANMPRSFWGEAVLSAAYLINRIPSSILNFQTPLQTLYHHIQIPHTKNLEPGSLAVWSSFTYMITNAANWIPTPKNVFSSTMHLIRKGTGVIILRVSKSILLWMLCSGNPTYIF